MPDYSVLFTSGNQPPKPLQQSQALFVQNRIAAKQKEDEARAKRIKTISNNRMVYPPRPTSPGNKSSKSFVGATRPSNLPNLPKTPKSVEKFQQGAFKTIPAYSKKYEFGRSFKDTAKKSITPLIEATKTSLKLFKDKQTREDLKKGYQIASKKLDEGKFLQKGLIKTTQAFQRSPVKNVKAFVTVATPVAASIVSDIKTPTGRGKLAYHIAELTAFAGAGEVAKIGQTALRNIWVKTGAKKISIKDFLSSQAIKKGIATTGLPKAKSIEDLVSKVKKTKGFYPEYPEHFVLTSSEPVATKNAIKILTQAEKKAAKLKVRKYDDPGKWFTSKGEANIWALRLNNKSNYKSLKFSLFPAFKKSTKPGYLDLLVKRVERLPVSVLKKDVGFSTVAEYQKFLAKSKPSTSLIAKRSEVSSIGDKKIRDLIKKVDPKSLGSPEIQFVQISDTIIQPAAKLKSKKLLGRFKGYDEFVKIEGVNVPLRKAIVSGASIYKKGKINLAFRDMKLAGQKGFVDLFGSVKTKVTKDLGKVADYFGEKSFFSAKKSAVDPYKYFATPKTFNVNVGAAGLGYLASSRPNIKSTLSLTGMDPVYSNYKNKVIDSSSIIYTTKPNYKNIFYNKESYAKSKVKEADSYLPPKPKDKDSYFFKEDDRDPIIPPPPTYYPDPIKEDSYIPIYAPDKYTLAYPSKPYLTGFFKKPTNTITTFKTPRTKGNYKKDTYNKTQAFDVLVRTKGKWTKVSTPKTLNYFAAKQKGFSIADNYAERSVKLKPTNKIAQVISRTNPRNAYKFSWNKSKNVKLKLSFIEKSKYAIDTKGEFNKITYKGIMSRKKKKGFVFWLHL